MRGRAAREDGDTGRIIGEIPIRVADAEGSVLSHYEQRKMRVC